jgi:single-stranded DNA-binding protein
LCVSHKTSKGEWRRELYTVNSWNTAAQWVIQNLKQGQRVALLGYLTQRTLRTGDGIFVSVEVTSQEFLPMESKPQRGMSPYTPEPDTAAQKEAVEDRQEAMAV